MAATMKLVRVDWIDSAGATEVWQAMSDLKRDPSPCECQSVGWVLHEDDKSIMLAPHIGHESGDRIPDQACGVMTIPKCAVREVVELIPDRVKSAVRGAVRKVKSDKRQSKRSKVASGKALTQHNQNAD